MRNLIITTFLALIFVVAISIPLLTAQEDFELFNEAMELRIQCEWDAALQKYQLLKQKYPSSKYVDDAAFWSAYILEEQGKDKEAFKAYQSIKQKYPNSPWADDATMHQIGLAEKFVKQGQNSYRSFLTKELESPHKNVKYQAALSLGKLGDDRAVPVLKEMSNNGDKDMRSVGNSLLRKFEQPKQLDRPRFQPFPTRVPKNRVDKKNKTIKKPPRYEPKQQRQTPGRKPEVQSTTKRVRPVPKQRLTRPQKTSPKKKGKYESPRQRQTTVRRPAMQPTTKRVRPIPQQRSTTRPQKTSPKKKSK